MIMPRNMANKDKRFKEENWWEPLVSGVRSLNSIEPYTTRHQTGILLIRSEFNFIVRSLDLAFAIDGLVLLDVIDRG